MRDASRSRGMKYVEKMTGGRGARLGMIVVSDRSSESRSIVVPLSLYY